MKITDWDRYWSLKSYKRKLIEILRRIYFLRVFTREIISIAKWDSLILEAGCGSGTYVRYLNHRGFRCLGIDLSQRSIEFARNKVDVHHLLIGDIKNLPFKSKVFDIVFNQGVMEHFSDDDFRYILKELSRVSNKVVIIVPSFLSLFRIYDPIKDDLHKRYFSKKDLLNILSLELQNAHARYMWETGFLSIVGRGESDA